MADDFVIPEQYAEKPWAEGVKSQEDLFAALDKASTPKEFAVPDEFKEKGWASKIKSEEDVWKQIDTLDSLKGRKHVPFDYEKATPKELEDHLNARRPEKAELYEIGEEGDNENVINGMKEVAHKIGLEPWQAKGMAEAFREYEVENKKAAFDPNEFNKMLEASLGADYKKEAGLTANELKQHMNEEEKAFFDQGFPNKHADFVYKIVNRMMKAYGVKEGHLPDGGDPPGGGGGLNSIEKIDAAAKAVRKQINDLSKAPHSEADKKALVAKLNDLSRKKIALQQKK